MTEPRIVTRELAQKWRAEAQEKRNTPVTSQNVSWHDEIVGAAYALDNCADELEAALPPADAPPRLSEAEVRTCATCVHSSPWRSELTRKCNKGVADAGYRTGYVAPDFGCNLHEPATLYQPSGETPKET